MSGKEPRQPRAKTIPPKQHKNYVLLWNFVDDEVVKGIGKPETCWLRIAEAFWAGELPALFCFTHPKSSGVPGRVLLALPPREVLAGHLLGQERDIDATALAELRGWTLDDYLHDPIFGEYATRDPCFGLAARKADLQRWRMRHHAKHARGATPTKREDAARLIRERYPDGRLPANVTAKELARDLGVSDRTVRRALGRN
jgi:hypothetical protein